MNNLTYYQRNRKVMLNRAKDYYENGKERLRELAWDKYRNLSEEDKNKKNNNKKKNRYHNMFEEKKKKTKRISKKIPRSKKKSKYNNE